MKICGGSELFQKILNVAGYTHGIVVDPNLLFVAPGQGAVETLRRDCIYFLSFPFPQRRDTLRCEL